jgi:hypothetical protein
VVLLVAAAISWAVRLDRNLWANEFYSAAVQAGTKSWKAFWFASSDHRRQAAGVTVADRDSVRAYSG